MRAVFFPLLGMLAMACAITPPPEPSSLIDLCAEPTFITSAMNRALQIKYNPVPDPEMDRRRLTAIGALVNISTIFQMNIKRSPQISRAAFIIVKEIIYNIEEYIAGELRSCELNERAKPLANRVVRLLEDAEDMRRFFEAARTTVDQLELNLEHDWAYGWNYIKKVELEIEETRQTMEIDKLNAFPPFAQANVRTTAQQLVTTSEAAATVRGDIGLTYNEIIQRSRNFIKVYHDVIYLGAVVEEAEDVTKAHIEYWSHTLDVLANLQKTGQDWLEDPWSAKRALAQWKIVLQKYGECSHMDIGK